MTFTSLNIQSKGIPKVIYNLILNVIEQDNKMLCSWSQKAYKTFVSRLLQDVGIKFNHFKEEQNITPSPTYVPIQLSDYPYDSGKDRQVETIYVMISFYLNYVQVHKALTF